MKTSLTFPIRSILILAALTLSAATGNAQTQIQWSATAGSGTWATNGNWVGGTAPANDLTSNTALFNSATYAFQPVFSNTLIGGIEIGSSSGGFSFTGTTLTLGNVGTGTTGILMDAGSGAVTISAATVKIGANENWNNNASGLLTVSSNITNVANATPFTLTFAGSGSGGTTLSGTISNGGATGTTAVVVNTTGGGVTWFKGVNTYTGGLTIQNGIVEVSGGLGLLGAGTVTFGTGSAGTNTLEFNGSGVTFTNAVTLTTGDTTTFDVVVAGAQTFTFSNNITGGGALVVSSAVPTGIVLLSGSNSYGGGTTISSGILEFGKASAMSGTGAVTVNSGTTMEVEVGTGTFFTNATSGNGSLGGIFNNQGGQGGGVTLNTGSTVGIDTTNAGGLFAYSGAITIAGVNLTKLGAGTLVFSGLNTYTGITTITGGTLNINSIQDAGSTTANALGEASGTNATIGLNGGTLQFVGSSAGNSNRIMNLTGQSALDSSGSTAFNLSGGITITGTAAGLTLTGTGAGSEIGAIGSNKSTSALASLTKSGSGMWTLSNNVFVTTLSTGKYTINAGTLDLASTSALYAGATGSWTAANIIVKTGSTLAFGVGGTGGFSSGNMDSLVTALVTGGTATTGFASGSAIGFDTTGGSFSFGGGSDPVIANSTSGSGVIGLTKLGANTLTLAGANTYTGVTTISGGNLNVGVAETAGVSGPLGNSAAANPGSIVFNGGTLQYSSANQNDYSGRFSTAASQPISIDTNGQAVTFATGLQGSGTTLTLNDTASTKGSLTLSATSTYSGATNINGGTLILANTGNIAASATTISGGTLSGSGLAGAVTLTTGLIAPATSGGDTASVLKASSLTWNSGGSLAFNLSTTNSSSTELTLSGALIQGTGTPGTGAFAFDLSGGLNTAGTDYTLMTFTNSGAFTLADFSVIDSGLTSGLTGTLVLNATSVQFDITTAAPEPGTWALMLGGLAVLVFIQIRRRKNSLS